MPTLIRELIDLPEHVHQGDFVLRLTEGVQRPQETIRDYVVTPQLAQCFDEALGFIRSALDARSSKAAYLHGSFGSGKSHFMAVLHQLLQHDTTARGIPELAPVVTRHNGWTAGKRFLLVPYHMIGARSMESAILGHYASHVRTLHPDAPPPGVYKAEALFEDARRLRAQIGDDAFFAALNEGGSGSGWGSIDATWDATSFDDALASAPGAQARADLVGVLIERFFSSYQDVAEGQSEAYVPLDVGLSAISRHARVLGYDAVILFLDELILWLASHAADPAFVSREGQKLAQLVEAQAAQRPVPIVSFVARQRDLRDLVGTHGTGAEGLIFADVVRWWGDRFHTITLEDRNLPVIAQRRVLRPRSAAAEQMLDGAFREATKVRQEVMSTLLTSSASPEMFRQVYPFSPALVQALVAVSSALQRERTALKVMLQLLVEQRDTLQLGDLVPVGDLFDVIAEGDQAFSEGMKIHFDNARRLYHRKLLPMLETEHGLRFEDWRALPRNDPKAQRFRADDRLVKTLLLSALVPEVEALKALTPVRLAALNHGSIHTPIPGGEGREVLRRVRRWAAQVGEIRIAGDGEANPTITLQVTGVDTESIIEQARIEDKQGNRKRLLKELLFQDLGIANWDGLFVSHRFPWRGSERRVEVVFGNVWEMPDDSFITRGDEWRVIVDYPFDEQGRTPKDDIGRLERFRQEHDAARTIAWIPAFLSRDAQQDLGTLVILEYILAGERFASYSTHLPTVDRAAARQLLDNRRSQLRQKMRTCLESAYGVHEPISGCIDQSHELAEHFQALYPGLTLQPPVVADLKGAFLALLDQMLAFQFSEHPDFKVPVKLALLRKVWPELQRAAQNSEGRIAVEPSLRSAMRDVAVPLELGQMAETHFVLAHHWRQHFERRRAATDGPLTVRRLRAWIDEPTPHGLSEEVQNLVILTYAEQLQLAGFLHGGPVALSLDNLSDDVELRTQALPEIGRWREAVRRAQEILGIAASELLNAGNVTRFIADVTGRAKDLRPAAHRLVERLSAVYKDCGLDSARAPRMTTAMASAALLERVVGAESNGVIETLSGARVETSASAMARSLVQAAGLVESLDATSWDLFHAIGRLRDQRADAAAVILGRVRSALEADEYATAAGLRTELQAAQRDAARLLSDVPASSTPPTSVAAAVVPPARTAAADSPTPGWHIVTRGEEHDMPGPAALEVLDELRTTVSASGRRRLTLSWRIEEQES